LSSSGIAPSTIVIGSDAAIFLGSPSTDVWTNLEARAPAPVADRDKFLSADQAVTGTPWRLVMHFPLGPVREAASAFVRRMVLVTVIAVIIGLVGTWYISRSVLRALESTVRQRTAELQHVLQELRDAQETLVRKEKLAMLGQLASGVGHELRNPLGVMTNAIYFLRMVTHPPQPQVAEYLDILQQQVTLSEKIVSDLLDFARLKQPQRSAVSLADITQTQIDRLGATNGVHIDREMNGQLPRVMVDEVQIGQIVLNLLTNAVQAMDGAGRIVIRAHAENGHVHYDVADSGPGIASENIHKIFEPLFTTKARGIGLGLAVSRTLARANEGDLTVTSAPGQGAVFRLTLPAAKDHAEPAGRRVEAS
jgi:signal transduction histidine kinase